METKINVFQRGGTQLTAPSQHGNPFNSVAVKEPDRNVFNLSHNVNLTCNFGELVPIMCREVLPGDTWKHSSHVFMRFAPQLAPVLSNINVSIMSFFVPNRLLYKGWETFITGGKNGDSKLTNDRGEYVDFSGKVVTSPITCAKPFYRFPDVDQMESWEKELLLNSSLLDYIGYPTFNKISDITQTTLQKYPLIDALPVHAYRQIVNDYFINRNITDTDAITIPVWLNGTNVIGQKAQHHFTSLLKLAHINYSMDYFTSCLPDLQRGSQISIGKQENVYYQAGGNTFLKDEAGHALTNETMIQSDSSGNLLGSDHSQLANIDNSANLFVNNTTTIQELRYLTRLQQWLETSERVGSRYTDLLKGFFGVTSSDARLQRAEYLGGSIIPVVKSDIEQTSESQTTALGTLGGKSIAVGQSNTFTKYFEEHGWLFTIMCCMPDVTYINTLDRQFMRTNRFHYYWTQFAQLSEQAVTARELFTPTTDAQCTGYNAEDIFGYQQRYAEYRFISNTAHGDFKNTLSYWIFPRVFDKSPQLNSAFLKSTDVPQTSFATNLVASSDGSSQPVDKLWCQIKNETSAVRAIVKYPVPSL